MVGALKIVECYIAMLLRTTRDGMIIHVAIHTHMYVKNDNQETFLDWYQL